MSYDQAFFDYVNSGSTRSARAVLPLLQAVLPVRSVLDAGCGAGAWLAAWRSVGVDDVIGLDGDYVDRRRLLISADRFVAVDLAHGFDCGRQFDLVQCLEVAEHLPPESADRLVASLVRHAGVVLFSAAPPGQGGDHHVNERSYEYWRERFAACGYRPVDYLRPLIAGHSDIEPWYRYNVFLYVDAARIHALDERLRAATVSDGEMLADLSPLPYRLRKAVIRQLPVWFNTALAKLKERVMSAWRRSAAAAARP
ncbi:methyltransferase domain-containing protein [Piscinibacter sp. XHJ-5]|uniref:class I SAM-dependent methyltransferase n=1 Tax=Piscinibacter sp. XHJ-5 TaxID=3037797 RepID=UPI0024532219|nr:methyltransferase domain-containing protein [Piscinibacter sp. XHJ-5]